MHRTSSTDVTLTRIIISISSRCSPTSEPRQDAATHPHARILYRPRVGHGAVVQLNCVVQGRVPPRTWKEEEMVVITVIRRCHRVNNFGQVRSAWPGFSERIYRSTGSRRQPPTEILFLSVVYNLIRCECFLICNLRCCVIELLNVAWNYCQVTFVDQVVGWKL